MAKRRFLGRLILCLALAGSVAADPPTSVIIGTPPQPGWGQLSTTQKTILAPLVNDWDKMENVRRKKWLGIAERYPAMNPEEQQRTQLRMREWAELKPEQRTKVRDTYKDFNQLPPEQKQLVKQKWEAYSNLPADEKQRIRESGKSAKLLAPPPPPADASPAIPADGSQGSGVATPASTTETPKQQ
jgi:hypothetical protein